MTPRTITDLVRGLCADAPLPVMAGQLYSLPWYADLDASGRLLARRGLALRLIEAPADPLAHRLYRTVAAGTTPAAEGALDPTQGAAS